MRKERNDSIVRDYQMGLGLKSLARKYGLSMGYIRCILTFSIGKSCDPDKARAKERLMESIALDKMAGKNVDTICRRHGVSTYLVYKSLKSYSQKNGVPVLDGRIARFSSSSTRNHQMLEDFQSGKSIEVLADKYKVSRQRIYQIVTKTAKRLGVKLRDRVYRHGSSFAIPNDMVDTFLKGELPLKKMSESLGCSPVTAIKVIKDMGLPSFRDVRRKLTRLKWRKVYDEFSAGASLKDLAKKYNMSTISVGQMLLRHRRITGEPGRWPYRGRRALQKA